jgi:hypothetical protein
MKQGWLILAVHLILSTAGCGIVGDKPDSGVIITDCTRVSDCPSGTVCSQRACVVAGSRAIGQPCSASRDCVGGSYCSVLNQRCVAEGTGRIGDGCVDDGGCASGLRCSYAGFTGSCAPSGTVDLLEPCTRQTDCLAGLFCGFTNECTVYADAFPRFAGVSCVEDTGPFHGYFEVPRSSPPELADFYRLPYPNDIRVSGGAAKTLDLSDFPRPGLTPLGVDVVKLYIDALVTDFQGFSTVAPVSFRFSAPIDFDHLQANALGNLRFVDLSNGAELGFGYGWTTDRSRYSCPNFLTVSPAFSSVPLQGGRTYAVLLGAAAVRSASGAEAQQDPDLAAVLAGSRPSGDEALGRAWDAYAPLRSYLTGAGISPATVVNAAVFTTADVTVPMQRVATAVAAQPAPVLTDLHQCGSGGTDACDDGSDARRCGAEDPDFVEIHGKIRMPIFQTGTAPYERPDDGGGLNEMGAAVAKVRDEEVCFALTLPRGEAPGAGWPLVVHSHGTGGSFRSFIADGVAKTMATASPKAAVVSFDNVGHGLRRGASTRSPEELVFNVLNPRAARDNFAHGAADILTALRLPAAAAPPGWAGPALRLAAGPVVFGHSQGATHASLALPFTDEARAAVLSGAGAGLGASLLNKTSPVSVSDGLTFLIGERLDNSHPMIVMWQNYFDRADPMNFNRHIIERPLGGRAPKHVFMSWGTGDTFSPEPTLFNNAHSLGVPPLMPVLRGDGLSAPVARPARENLEAAGQRVTAVVSQYAPSGYDGHFVAQRNSDAVRDWTAFVTSFFTSGVPQIP